MWGKVAKGRTRRKHLTLAGLALLSVFATAQAGPSSFDTIATKAAQAVQQNDNAGAIELYRQALQLKPAWTEGWWLLGRLQYDASDYAAGRDSLTRSLEGNSNPGPALGLRGLCEFEIGDYEQSLSDIQQALALGAAASHSANEIVLRYHQALLLTLSGDFEGALREYTRLSKEPITDPEFLMNVGLAGLRTPLLVKDVNAKERELSLAAGSAAFQLMGGEDEKAKQAFQDLFRRFPNLPNLHYLYGYLLFSTDPERAVPEFRRELEIAPSNAAAQVMLAWDLVLQDDFSQALSFAQKAAAESPESPGAQLVLGRSLVETGNIAEGLNHLETALKLDPQNLEVHLALVKGYSESGRKDDALRERRLCLEMTKGAAAATVHP